MPETNERPLLPPEVKPEQIERAFDALEKEFEADEQRLGLPVPGYRSQRQEAIDLVSEFKIAEEKLLRRLDELTAMVGSRVGPGVHTDPRWLAIGRTHLEQAFMAINRSIFRPTRIGGPLDNEQANLGLATNAEIEAELEARRSLGHTAPGYRTVDE